MLRKLILKYSWLLVAFTISLTIQACKSTSYPCPKKNDKRSAQLSKSDGDGAMPTGSSRGKTSKKNNGLVNKKQPKRIHKK